MKSKKGYYFKIDLSGGVPIYRQLVDQIKTLIATGFFNKGDLLPSVRQVAKSLSVNPMTVSKAYSLLVRENVLEFVRGKGMKVKKGVSAKRNLEKRKENIVPLLKEVVNKTNQLSLKPGQIIQLLKSLY